MHEYYPYEDSLEHYGVKGMKWGVRKQKDPISKYKNKQRKKVNKVYDKAIKSAKKLSELYPDDKSIKQNIKNLTSTYKQDMKKIDDMTYYDVMNAKKADAAVAKQKRDAVVKSVQSNVLWAGKMGLLGIRAYGTFKTVEILGTAGGTAIAYLQSEAGRDLVNAAVDKAVGYVHLGDSFVNKFTGMDVSANAIFGDPSTRVSNVDSAVRSTLKEVEKEVKRNM